MTGLNPWLDRAGRWHGTTRLHLSPGDPPDESPSTLDVEAAVGGRFVRLDQGWTYKGQPQQGTMLVGHDPKAGTASVHWADTFHMGRKVLACTGTLGDDGIIDVRGTYSAGAGPDWGWRIQLGGGPGPAAGHDVQRPPRRAGGLGRRGGPRPGRVGRPCRWRSSF